VLTRAALVAGDVDDGVLPTGQVVGVIDDLPTVAELLASIEADALASLAHRTPNEERTRT
jgi:NAD(P)H-dependent flavin oxidoreductase YrpB (nitropropane dioxygenase family)